MHQQQRRASRDVNTFQQQKLHPNYNTFGLAEYIDRDGREYRVAQRKEVSNMKMYKKRHETVLFVRIPKASPVRSRNPSTGRLSPKVKTQAKGYRWPRPHQRMRLFNIYTQQTASAKVVSLSLCYKRSSVARLVVKEWSVSIESMANPSTFLKMFQNGTIRINM